MRRDELAGGGEIRPSPSPLQVSTAPTHSICYAIPNYSGPARFFQESVLHSGLCLTYAVWGESPCAAYFVSAVSLAGSKWERGFGSVPRRTAYTAGKIKKE